MISDVIANGSLYPNACERLFSDIDQQPLSRVLAILQKPLIDFAVSLAGTNDDDSDTKPEGETTSFVEHYERLFGIATVISDGRRLKHGTQRPPKSSPLTRAVSCFWK